MKQNMHLNASPRIFRNAARLRTRMTIAEQFLWEHLRDRKMEGEKFRRQHPAKKFAIDFYCYKLRLGIELDGEYHNDPVQQFYDEDRTDILEGYTLHILRFSNESVCKHLVEVLDKIRAKIFSIRSQRENSNCM